MGDFDKARVLDIFEVLQLPHHVEGDMDGPGTDGEGRGDVALQRVTHHQQFVGQDT